MRGIITREESLRGRVAAEAIRIGPTIAHSETGASCSDDPSRTFLERPRGLELAEEAVVHKRASGVSKPALLTRLSKKAERF
jgi:hypothetical protein